MASHPALAPGRTAVITGGASGIGLAVARSCLALGMQVCIADRPGEALEAAAASLDRDAGRGTAAVLAVGADVSDPDDLATLKTMVYDRFGDVGLLMNNAGVGAAGTALEAGQAWHDVLGVNLWGVIHGVQAFAGAMLAQGRPGAIVNTGSKQGITLPPGNTAYNVSKAAVKAFTESTAHELRSVPGGQVSAHLLIPGYTYTGMTARSEKPAAAWTADQVAAFMLDGLGRGDFYLLCPDNDVDRATDERRMAWAVGDIIHNRPALSRWHPDHAEAFKAFMSDTSFGS